MWQLFTSNAAVTTSDDDFAAVAIWCVTVGVIVICILRGQHQKDSFYFMFVNVSWFMGLGAHTHTQGMQCKIAKVK